MTLLGGFISWRISGMAWTLYVKLQKRGTQDESAEWLDFDSKADAEAADQKLQADRSRVEEHDTITVVSPNGQISFLKRDYLRTKIQERMRSGQVRRVY
jgi:hypothetical protein